MSRLRRDIKPFQDKYFDIFKKLSKNQLRSMFKEPQKDIFKLLVVSDVHGSLMDKKAVDCVLAVIKDNSFNEIVDNGDTVDLPYLSGHIASIRRLNDDSDLLRNYSEIQEIEYTKNNYLKPLKEVAGEAKVIKRDGNHDERITKPKKYSKLQLERLTELTYTYQTTQLENMLDLKQIGIKYDPSPVRTYYDMFQVTHGLSLSKNAPLKNIEEYLSSGTTGHTHRLNSSYLSKRGKHLVWFESGCLRHIEQVEYFPTAKTPNWQQGFVTVTFDLSNPNKPTFYGQTHAIINGQCLFNGRLYSWRDLK